VDKIVLDIYIFYFVIKAHSSSHCFFRIAAIMILG